MYLLLITAVALSACQNPGEEKYLPPNPALGSLIASSSGDSIVTRDVKPEKVVEYAKTLLGTPYLYGSTDPSAGFDCSGFITYVFNHFKIKVPRSSVDFTNRGKQVVLKKAKPGDLILFTGTDTSVRRVGHMGIIVSNAKGDIQFIHSSSGKGKGVVVTTMEKYYQSRFVKVIRVFPEEAKSTKKKIKKLKSDSYRIKSKKKVRSKK